MIKQCWICKNTEEYFLNQKKELLDSIEKELQECDEFEQNIRNATAEKLGFTEESKSAAKKIQDVYTKMTLSAVQENKENFLQLEPNLKVILDYCEKFSYSFKNVADAIEKFLQEPTEDKYANEMNKNKYKMDNLLYRKSEIEKIKTFFIEKDFTNKYFDNSGFKISSLGFKFDKKILICPICSSLLKEASDAAFEVTEAQRRANELAMDWDDDDDDDWE